MELLGVNTGLPEFPTLIDLLHYFPKLTHVMSFLLKWQDIFFSALVAGLVSLFFYVGTRKRELIPHGLQNFLEIIVESAKKVIGSILGDEEAEKHVPFLGTLFIYILVMNLFGLIPFMKSPSSSINISIALGLCVFLRVQYLNIKNMGFFGYFYHLAGSPKNFLGWVLSPLMLPIEIITQVSRPFTLALRLTGNMIGEHTLITIFAFLSIMIFSLEALPIGLPIQLPVMLFGMLTSLMQAIVFTLLSTIYILLSKPHAESH